MNVEQVDAELAALQAESVERFAELRRLAAELPQATSRRRVLTSMIRDVAAAPDRPLILKRVVLKLLRTPSRLFRRESRR